MQKTFIIKIKIEGGKFIMGLLQQQPLSGTPLDNSTETSISLVNPELEAQLEVEKKKQEIAERLKNSPEVQNIVRSINVNDTNNILTFGKETAEEISKFTDRVLATMQVTKVEDSGELLIQLNKIMDKFDIKEFEETKPGLFGKLFSKAKDSIEAIFAKYRTMGDEVDKIYVELKKYENEINKTNQQLEVMFIKNVEYYEQLTKYIFAAQLAIDELSNEIIPSLDKNAQETGNKMDQINCDNMRRVLEMFEQRVMDLEKAEHIAIQSMPIIRGIEYGNYNLVRKINSAFIITMPIFKQCLAQTIMLKRQAIQAKAMSALDEKTNELILRNAENSATQTKLTAKMASESFASIETLEKSWNTIMTGIEETKRIEAEVKAKRQDEHKRLQILKEDYMKRGQRI
jgi:uncharacterized protein YaaN involved in tellurite resistance